MRNRQSGQTLPLFGLLIAVLFGFLAMAVDLGQGYLARRTNQAAADAASVAGIEAMQKGAGDTGVKNAITNVLVGSGFTASSLVFATSGASTPGNDATKAYVNAEYGSYGSSSTCTVLSPIQYVGSVGGNPPGGATCVHVLVTTSKNTLFANVPIIGVAQLSASAVSSAGRVQINTGVSPASNVTGATYGSSSVVFTFTTTATAPAVGSWVTISGVTPGSFNGTYQVVSSTTGSVTVTVVSNPGTYTSGGTITFNSTGVTPTPSPTPAPTAAPWDTGAGQGWTIWGGKRADSRTLNVGDSVLFFADSGWNSGNDVQTSCSPCEYQATQNFKGIADPQCFTLPLTTTCSGPNGAHGNAAASISPGTVIEVVVTSSVTHQGNNNVLTRIGLANVTVLASCPSPPSYLQTGTNGVCGVISALIAGQLNEGVIATPTPTPSATSTPTPVPTYLIGNTP